MTRRGRTFAILGAVLAGAALAAGMLHRHRGGDRTPDLPSTVDARYWYLDIYDDFFAEELRPDGRAYRVSRRPLSRPSSFPALKSTDTFRVFVIGGSVAYQYELDPQRIAGRALQDVLEHVLPGRRVEVVHCGMGAYDSYRETLVLKEVLRYAPDLIVLMSGNNESRSDAGPPPRRVLLALRLRRWLGLPQSGASAPLTGPGRPIPLGPFADYLRGMVLAARRAGAATVLCTLPRRLDNPPGGHLPPWLWHEDALQAWNPEGKDGLSSAAAFWRRSLSRHPEEEYAHYFLARTLARQGDTLGALREYAAAKKCRGALDTNAVVRAAAAELETPLADLEAAFDGLPYARDGGKIYRDPTHWYRFMDPVVSYAIARSLVHHPTAAKGPLDAAWLRREGSALAAPKPDPAEPRKDYVNKLSWAISISDRDSPRISEQILVSLEDLRELDPAAFAALPWLKPFCREAVESNPWTRSGAGGFERRWAFALVHAGEVYRRSGQPRRALEYFDEALRAAPNIAFWGVYQALALRQLGRRKEAASVLSAIAGPELSSPEVQSIRGLWGLRTIPHPAQPALPRPALQAALKAESLRRQGRSEEALAVIAQALARAPRDPKLLNDKGVLESLQGRPRQAQADLEGAIAADPDFASAYLSLGALLASRGERAQARRAYTAALSRRRIWDDPAPRRALQEALRSLAERP
ncbi:MAG: tetratricopeptide repeat protein [Elusimicrobia bacterium]|nr:tetratricopeptide repeat protein [Elusimicrobiota bacterium]